MQKFREECPGQALPPKPVTTRWGTWLEAAVYYCDNFDQVKSVVGQLNDADAEAIKMSKAKFAEPKIKNDLAFIKANFASIVNATVKLETQGLPLNDSVETYDSIRKSLNSMKRKDFVQKMEAVNKRNAGYKDIVAIRDVLNGHQIKNKYVEKLSPNELTMFRYCPVTSSDVERSFSRYKGVLTEKRRTFTFENLKKHMIVYCNRKTEDQ